MPAKKKKTTYKSVKAIRHDESKRKNIPTAEHRSVVENGQKDPKELRYPRNTDLDPQLVWRGKDEQDWSDLVVHAPPLYIQEKVHPKALIDDLLRQSKKAAHEEGELTPDLFADFNGIPKDVDKTEFYQHDQNWSNRMILGDSLQVMASLAEREGLRGRVQCIYLDPPYGIKFNSNFQWSTTSRDVKDGQVDHITREPEQVKAFRDTWRDGIHSYLTYLRDRLTVARDLLTDSGSIFVQIGDENVHRVRSLMDEVLGDENFVAMIYFQTAANQNTNRLQRLYDVILWYKGKGTLKFREIFRERDQSEIDGVFTAVDEVRGEQYKPAQIKRDDQRKAIIMAGRMAPAGNAWKRFISDFPVVRYDNVWKGTIESTFSKEKIYVVQTNRVVSERCLLMATDPGDLVLDPTCGSGTTATVAEQWGRRWITIDTSRVALALARARIMGARYPFYLLADSREGQQKEAEITNTAPSSKAVHGNIRHGFVYKRVPHITLTSIANNAEIHVIWERWQDELEPLRSKLNKALKKSFEEWEIPREAEDEWPTKTQELFYKLRSEQARKRGGSEAKAMQWLDAINHNLKRSYTLKSLPERPADPWPEDAAKLHAEWWEARIARQREIDASIAAKADPKYFYDKPYENKRCVRVAGPFTVESLSPHRVLGVDEDDELIDPLKAAEGEGDFGQTFEKMVLENLKSSGVQQAHKEDRISFTSLTGWPGEFICAEGRYLEGEQERRAGIFLGPEFGTVTRPDLVDAAKEAGDAGFDVLIACAFNFEAHAGEFHKLGKIPILKARMNADLHMAEDLKNTGKGNLFVIFGEPDIDVVEAGDDQLEIRVNGVDVFDPTTGEVRSDSADGIACWFIDTDYNGESFFVRHAYFLGQNDPYRSLKTSLKAEIDKDAWESLHSDISRPFEKPASGRVAVKVINHLGDEVMKVFRV